MLKKKKKKKIKIGNMVGVVMDGSGKRGGKWRWREGVVKWGDGGGVRKKKLKWKDTIHSKEKGSMLIREKKKMRDKDGEEI
jgi:hypothetical protein